MTGRVRFRSIRARQDTELVRKIAPDVWGFDPHIPDRQLASYLDHYRNSKSVLGDDKVIVSAESLCSLVKVIRANSDTCVQQISTAIETAQPQCLAPGFTEDSTEAALRFGCQLWLFTNVDVLDPSTTLKSKIELDIARLCAGTASKTSKTDSLSPDFNEKNLTRKGGIKIIWTSDIFQHLKFLGKSSLQVFRHASCLSSMTNEQRPTASGCFPADFMEETQRTIKLLFPENIDNLRRNRRISMRQGADIELGLTKPVSYDLSKYIYWGERLVDVQDFYNNAKPRYLKQWIYDRRNRYDWAAFWVAIVVFALTVFFGTISSVTACWQVYLLYNPPT